MKNLILTLDYELYGDGSGDVFEHMVWPTDRILEICDQHNIKITLFFEVLEYIKLKVQWDSGNHMGYKQNPVAAIEGQIKAMAKNGHDIQLHVHPQWVNAEYINDKWKVDFDNWRLGDFSVAEDYDIEDMLRECKQTLEELIRPVDPDYHCVALRAGGYNIMPSQSVYQAMVNVELAVDSSVYPGGYETGVYSRYDYRKAPLEKDYWPAKPNDFTESFKGSKVLEFPVFSLLQRRYKKFTLDRIRSAMQNRSSAAEAIKAKTERRSLLGKVKYFFEFEAFTWDFCLFSFRQHRQFIEYIDKYLEHRSLFVLVGHPKSFTSEQCFKQMLEYSKNKDFGFITLRNAESNFIN